MATLVTDKMLAVFIVTASVRMAVDGSCQEGEGARAGLEAIAPMIRNAAIEEAAQRIEPNNPESDWTEYARDCARLAGIIRDLKTTQIA